MPRSPEPIARSRARYRQSETCKESQRRRTERRRAERRLLIMFFAGYLRSTERLLKAFTPRTYGPRIGRKETAHDGRAGATTEAE